MADQKIDSLTVDIGLTTDEFKEGVSEILNAINGMKQSTEEAAEGMGASFAEMSDGIAGLALKFTGLFFAVRGIEDVVGYFKELSHELANLSWAGEYLGQSSVQLSRFGEVAKLAGGQAGDAIHAVQSLQSAIFGLEYNGQMSQNLLMLNRLRVAYTDQKGNMLPIEQIAMNAAQSLQDQLGSGKQTEAMRVQWAAQIFGQGGLANAIGGGVAELRKFYAESAKDQKGITQKAIDHQRELQQHIMRLSYDVRSEAAAILDKLTPAIEHLISAIENGLIPTIDEVITDFTEWSHPSSIVDKAMSGKGVGSLWNPIHFFEAIGIGLGIRAAQVHDWWSKQGLHGAQNVPVPPEVQSRLAPGTDMEALKYLHYEAGGDLQDPTWSKTVLAYGSLQKMPGGPAAYVKYVQSHGSAEIPHTLPPPTPNAARPSASTAGHPIASTTGPRVTIGTVNVNAPNARDANGIAASIDRALQRKLLVAQADPGLA